MDRKKAIIPLIFIGSLLVLSILYFTVIRNAGAGKYKIEGSGTIEVTEIEIASKIAGRVAVIKHDEGEAVQKGDLLIKLDYDELTAQQNSAIANYLNEEENYRRVVKLYNSGSIAKKDLDGAATAFKVAKANVDMINASIRNAVLYSPIDGVVLEKNLELGEMAFPGSPIITIANLYSPWIKIYVPETKLGFVKLGQKAIVKIDSYPDRNFPGKVTTISSKAEFTPKTIQTKDERVKLMFAVKVLIENPDSILKPGMPADVTIVTEPNK